MRCDKQPAELFGDIGQMLNRRMSRQVSVLGQIAPLEDDCGMGSLALYICSRLIGRRCGSEMMRLASWRSGSAE